MVSFSGGRVIWVGTIEVANQDGTVHYKVEFNASTQAARTAAAR